MTTKMPLASFSLKKMTVALKQPSTDNLAIFWWRPKVSRVNHVSTHELGAPASLPACRGVDRGTRRQGCRRSQSGDQFITPTHVQFLEVFPFRTRSGKSQVGLFFALIALSLLSAAPRI